MSNPSTLRNRLLAAALLAALFSLAPIRAHAASKEIIELQTQVQQLLDMVQRLQSTMDAIRNYPEFPQGSRSWDERVYHPDVNGVVRPLSEIWPSGHAPRIMSAFLTMVRMLGKGPFSSSLRYAWSDSSQLRFELLAQLRIVRHHAARDRFGEVLAHAAAEPGFKHRIHEAPMRE